MPKYLVKASYTAQGARGVASEGGSSRRDAVKSATESVGGTMEAFYFAFGETDVYGICEMPDAVTAAAASLAWRRCGNPANAAPRASR